tara:strand:+ start:1008 stop:1343 length:336 start_codon:yes stop_codon:yes gene_type:complete
MDTTTIIEAWGTLGVTGVMAVMFGFMIANIIKSQNSQNDTLDKLAVSQAKSEETMNNLESIVLKLLDRIQRESEQGNDERNRRHEAISRDIADMDAQLSEIKGIISRLNGS